MKFINDNLKKAGYFNATLIIVSIIVKLITIKEVPTLVKIDSTLCIIALVFGLFYSLSGYKKDAAKYYKVFMYLYFVSNILSLASQLIAPMFGKKDFFVVSINAIVLILVFVLTFIKDLGVNKSTNISLIILLLSVIKLFYDVANKTTIPSEFVNLILACILCVFVSAKYKDKESRGVK